MKTRSLKHALVALAGGLLLAVPVLGWAGSPGGSDALQGHGDRAVIVQKARQPARHHWVRCHETHFQQGACKTLKAELASCQEDLAACLAEPCAIFPGDGQTGAPLSYTDNGDGTFTDDNTGLMWEIKDGADGVHNVGNLYTWTADVAEPPFTFNGTAETEFLAELNAEPGFAGHTDWRLPTVKELQSLVDYSVPIDPGPICPTCVAVSPDLPGATACSFYWSSTSEASLDECAWSVSFHDGIVFCDQPGVPAGVRAVRGGWWGVWGAATPQRTILGRICATGIPWGPRGIVGALEACEAELAQCQEQPGMTFPGDGQTGAPLAYEEAVPPDGTFTDLNTGLVWEMKLAEDDSACLFELQADRNVHCVQNRYTWTADVAEPPFTFNGTAETEFLAELNAEPGFAGHTDWRLPTVKELQSLVDYSVPYPGPVVKQDPDGLPGATAPAYWPWSSGAYWSSSSHAFLDVYAWSVPFGYGDVGYDNKASEDHVRAVRGGW